MENKQEGKYIERIEIKGLWGRYDVDWKLNSDVNILVGENGTGKSTILNVLMHAKERCGDNLKTANNIRCKDEGWFNNAHIIFKSQLLTPFNKKGNGVEKDSDGIIIPEIELIRTFDEFLNIGDLERGFHKNLLTQMDFHLDDKINAYVGYQLDQTKKILNQKITPEVAFGKIRYFIDTLNRLFAITDKVIDENENKLIFILDQLIKIEVNQLSSGEKQLLLLLLTVLCQDEKPFILLMDEPEISLHLRWQYELIEIIRTLNPNCQVIIATHSPSIFNHGWRDKLFWIEDIVKKKEVVHE